MSSCLEIEKVVFSTLKEMKALLEEKFIGFYVHGSLAMGGFNPKRSDMDILVVSNKRLPLKEKRKLAAFLLKRSNTPFPIELSILTTEQLTNWKHPSPFDFHYSESWRQAYEEDLAKDTYIYLNDEMKTDPDLAAHLTVLTNRGICLEGKPILEVFPKVPRAHYIASIMEDFKNCLQTIEQNPVYSTLNLLRVYWYLQEGVISSKKEAGRWGVATLPDDMKDTVKKVLECYELNREDNEFEREELLLIRDFIACKVEDLHAEIDV
ncbi:aminoglycoside adenylyltransferase domain-containing protein [Oceanobacillus kapialis]|uniref:aminoglycoside adenylyltransferase domain-containing protein n=1 Tax=Oceanobacillus kapialis TaxID=481353 RepID=UPI00384F9E5F